MADQSLKSKSTKSYTMKKNFIKVLALFSVVFFYQCSAPSMEEEDVAFGSIPKKANTNPFLNCACTESGTKITGSTAANWASQFAPLVKFDRAAPDYPTSVEDIWASSSPSTITCGSTLALTNTTSPASPVFPTYFDVQQHPSDSDKVFIDYWFTYKNQEPCAAGQGGHNYDWEHVVIQFKKSTSRIVTVTYFQHGGWYTKDWRNVAAGTRLVAFVGKKAHGMYHNSRSSSFFGYECTYYGDYRNPENSGDEYGTWNNLLQMDCAKTEFNFSGTWGGSGKGPLFRDRAYWNFASCNGSEGLFGTDGCSQSDFAVGTLLGGIN